MNVNNIKDLDRGKIRNRELAQQLRNFSGLRFGKITPTDIDGFVEFGDKIFIFIESKHGSADLHYGQKLALERVCNCCSKSGKISYVLIASHNTINVTDDIDFANIPVTKYFNNGKWTVPKTSKTIREYIDKILSKNNYKI